jgi:hypothetical protein
MKEAAAPSGDDSLEGLSLRDQWIPNESPTDGP